MTFNQKQNLLQFLGLYSGSIDGIWGPKSQAAMESVREKYPDLDDTVALLEAVAVTASRQNPGNDSFATPRQPGAILAGLLECPEVRRFT